MMKKQATTAFDRLYGRHLSSGRALCHLRQWLVVLRVGRIGFAVVSILSGVVAVVCALLVLRGNAVVDRSNLMRVVVCVVPSIMALSGALITLWAARTTSDVKREMRTREQEQG